LSALVDRRAWPWRSLLRFEVRGRSSTPLTGADTQVPEGFVGRAPRNAVMLLVARPSQQSVIPEGATLVTWREPERSPQRSTKPTVPRGSRS
jgi:hypothetical protein